MNIVGRFKKIEINNGSKISYAKIFKYVFEFRVGFITAEISSSKLKQSLQEYVDYSLLQWDILVGLENNSKINHLLSPV